MGKGESGSRHESAGRASRRRNERRTQTSCERVSEWRRPTVSGAAPLAVRGTAQDCGGCVQHVSLCRLSSLSLFNATGGLAITHIALNSMGVSTSDLTVRGNNDVYKN